MSFKDNLDYYGKTIKTIFWNVAEFTDGLALATVSGYAIYQALQPAHKASYWYWALLSAGVLIALQAFWLLAKHFNHPVAEVKK